MRVFCWVSCRGGVLGEDERERERERELEQAVG